MKVSGYPSYSALQPNDLLLIVNNYPVDPANKKITVKDFLGNLGANTSITGNLTVNGNVTVTGSTYLVSSSTVSYTKLDVNNLRIVSNGFIIQNKFTPSNSAVNEAGSAGKFSFDDNYIYVKTANNVTKRVALNTF